MFDIQLIALSFSSQFLEKIEENVYQRVNRLRDDAEKERSTAGGRKLSHHSSKEFQLNRFCVILSNISLSRFAPCEKKREK